MRNLIKITACCLIGWSSSMAFSQQNAEVSIYAPSNVQKLQRYVDRTDLNVNQVLQRMNEKQAFGLLEIQEAKQSHSRSSSSSNESLNGVTHQHFQQYYKGLYVEGGSMSMHLKDGKVRSITGTLAEVDKINVEPILSFSSIDVEALLDAEDLEIQYEDLLICRDTESGEEDLFDLAYKVHVHGHNPMIDMEVYINAHDGRIMQKENHVHGASADVQTTIYGERTIETSFMNNSFYALRNSNGMVNTFIGNKNNRVTSSNNVWGGDGFDDQARALTAHWGATEVHNFFKDNYGKTARRNIIIDTDANQNFVAWASGDDIHFKDFGFQLASLDVLAHEFAHGINTSFSPVHGTADQAITEGMCDMWGVIIEHEINPGTDIWLAGDNPHLGSWSIRDLRNPHNQGSAKAIGDYHWDESNYYSRSTVMSHWFYLIVEGDATTGIPGIGMEKGEALFHYILSNYFSGFIGYSQMAYYSLLAAEDLFGKYCDEYLTVEKAWVQVNAIQTVSSPVSTTASDIEVTDNVGQDESIAYHASSSVSANNQVSGNGRLFCTATNTLEFTRGFDAPVGTYVLAELHECINWMPSRIVAETYEEDESETVEEVMSEISFGTSIYPNPTTGIVNLQFVEEGEYHVAVFDILGKEILSSIVVSQQGQIDLLDFNSGIYIIRITSGNTHHNYQIVKE